MTIQEAFNIIYHYSRSAQANGQVHDQIREALLLVRQNLVDPTVPVKIPEVEGAQPG